MYEWMTSLSSTFNNGDPVAKTWFLVRHRKLPFALCIAYSLFVLVVGPFLMRNRTPFHLRTVMIVFNFSLVVIYSYNVLYLTVNLPSLGFEKLCKKASIAEDELAYKMASSIWILYMLKYAEFLDTVFFVLRKKSKQITHLHVAHHNFVVLAGWILMNRESNGFFGIPALVNSFVHVVMYTYYGLTAIGPHMRKYLWWKKYLTALQIIQFIFFLTWILVFSRIMDCRLVTNWLWFDVAGVSYFLYLFYKFYKSVYSKN